MTHDLRNRAILVYLKVSCWSARKLDRNASAKAVEDAGATADSIRANKNLLASADAKLRAIAKHGADMRRELEAKTTPWDDAGNRLLPNSRAMEVIARMAEMREQFEVLVDEFVAEYPMLRAQALHNLGDLANDDDYPEPHVVRDKFDVSLTYAPMAGQFEGDLRIGLSDQQVAALEQHMQVRMQQQMATALGTLWQRVGESVAHLAERMTPDESGKSKKFRDSMIDNLRELVNDLRALNVFDDESLEDARRTLAALSAYSADQLRTDVAAREHVRTEAQKLATTFASNWG